MDNDDVIASFEPVPPAPGKHYWNVSGATAWCARCGLSMRVVLSQLQAGYAPAPMVLVGSVAYDASAHGRCDASESVENLTPSTPPEVAA